MTCYVRLRVNRRMTNSS